MELGSAPTMGELVGRFERLKRKYSHRDMAMHRIKQVRQGHISDVSPDLFPEGGPFQEPIVANMIDVAARDLAEMIAPLPTINASQTHMVNDSDQAKADIRTRICMAYLTTSNFQAQMYTAADWYVTYGFAIGRVEIDPGRDTVVVRCIDPVGAYPEIDRFGTVTSLFTRAMISTGDLRELYPEHAAAIKVHEFNTGGEAIVELVTYHDKFVDMLIVPGIGSNAFAAGPKGLLLYTKANALGKCMIRCTERPGAVGPRGQFDDVLFVQLAKARFALLAMEAATFSVQAPIVVPDDVQDVPMGPGAVIRTNGTVQKVQLNVPTVAFQEQGNLDNELRTGSRYPEVRTGNTDASVITGQGVNALMGTMDTQVRTAQSMLSRFITDLLSLAMELDEFTYGKETRTLLGVANGTPFELKYKPARDIKGDYTVGVQYGLMAGLDPNRWLVFGLQANGAGLISKDFTRRQMPADFDASDEERKIDIEKGRDALSQAVFGYAQALPALVSQGQDGEKIIATLATFITARSAGLSVEDAAAQAFAPPPTPPGQDPNAQPGAGAPDGQGPPGAGGPMGGGAPPGGPGAPGPGGGQLPPGLGPNGLMQGVAPGQQGDGAGGRPELAQMLAGLSSTGQPNLAYNVAKRVPIGG